MFLKEYLFGGRQGKNVNYTNMSETQLLSLRITQQNVTPQM
jgi:hypothetical protein